MPELPDVEVFRRTLEASALGQSIRRVRVTDERVLDGVTPRELDRRLEGRTLSRTVRRGKVLFACAGDEWITLRFGMTAFLRAYRAPETAGDHERVIFDLRSGGHLAFDDQRMFGRVGLTPDPESFIRAHHLGPDARSIGRRAFAQRVRDHRGTIKAALMDQATVAGLGNVYTDEILFQAHLDPRTAVTSMSERELSNIHRAMRRVLERAIEAEANPRQMPRTWLTPVRGKDAHCPRCGTRLEAFAAGGRTTYACPRDQPPPE
jgi:formamidopyrimidine-DNA glycosylase